MICIGCRTAADDGDEGIEAHFNAGCPAITGSETSEGMIYGNDTARCDCQHRDDLPKRELRDSEV